MFGLQFSPLIYLCTAFSLFFMISTNFDPLFLFKKLKWNFNNQISLLLPQNVDKNQEAKMEFLIYLGKMLGLH